MRDFLAAATIVRIITRFIESVAQVVIIILEEDVIANDKVTSMRLVSQLLPIVSFKGRNDQ